MRKLLLLVLILTASASPPVHDEKLPFRYQPFDHVVKADVLTVVKKEPIVQHMEAEQDPLMQKPVADVVEPDSVLLEPERREEHRITEEMSVIVEEPVLEADYLTEDMPEAELEPEPEIVAIQINRNNIPVEEPVVELASVAEMESEKEEHLLEEPTLEGDFIVDEDPEEVMEPVRERRMALQTEPIVQHMEAEQDPLMQEPVADVVEADSMLLEPERREEHRIIEETSVIVEELVLEADYLTEDIPVAEIEPEPEIVAIQMNRNNIPVEEPVAEMKMEVESEKKDFFSQQPALEGDYIMNEDPEDVMEPVRERRITLQTGRWSCRGVVIQGKCYQFFRRNLDANTAELQCQEICPNGHLASVTSSYIRDKMGKLMDLYGGRTRAWLGGRRVLGTSNFRWLDGVQWSYNGWAFGEPNNAGGMENCVEILSCLTFNDVPCEILKPFICSCPL